ncbi:AraC family transcriptional regulator [Herbaspirillum rhizosphaerae]|uniref:AraC family transcriptional regulator n=1 Tax=Herbaspirillum rhizosphaerae TaxID=346179 RepID=UPI00067DEB06|nr:AraC family transcriptional regulator [Herbaspirillum rhizosphaerae]
MINRSHKLTAMLPDVVHCELSSADGYAMDWHAHDCHMLLLPRHGSLLLSTEDCNSHARLSSLSFSVIVPDFGHATSAVHGRESHLTLYVDPDYLRRYGPEHAGMDLDAEIAGHGQWQRSDILDSILALHDKVGPAAQSKSGSDMLRLHHLNHLLFVECMRIVAGTRRLCAAGKNGNSIMLIRQVQAFITDNLEAHHGIDTLCHQFHLSRRHLTRLFRDVTQETVVDYANRQRVDRAHRLIREHGMSALDAGLAVGIDSPSYLARLFRKYLGILPSDCRRHH